MRNLYPLTVSPHGSIMVHQLQPTTTTTTTTTHRRSNDKTTPATRIKNDHGDGSSTISSSSRIHQSTSINMRTGGFEIASPNLKRRDDDTCDRSCPDDIHTVAADTLTYSISTNSSPVRVPDMKAVKNFNRNKQNQQQQDQNASLVSDDDDMNDALRGQPLHPSFRCILLGSPSPEKTQTSPEKRKRMMMGLSRNSPKKASSPESSAIVTTTTTTPSRTSQKPRLNFRLLGGCQYNETSSTCPSSEKKPSCYESYSSAPMVDGQSFCRLPEPAPDVHTAVTPLRRNSGSHIVLSESCLLEDNTTNNTTNNSLNSPPMKILRQQQQQPALKNSIMESCKLQEAQETVLLSPNSNFNDWKYLIDEHEEGFETSGPVCVDGSTTHSSSNSRERGPVCIDDFCDDENIHLPLSVGNGCDDTSTVDSFWENQLNMSDGDLMDDGVTGSPGALRLTKEGLGRHDQKLLEELLHCQLKTPESKLEAWMQHRDRKRWHKQKYEATHKAMTEQTKQLSSGGGESIAREEINTDFKPHCDTNNNENQLNNNQVIAKSNVMKSLRSMVLKKNKKEKDVTDFSGAPLNTTNCESNSTKPNAAVTKKPLLNKIFRIKSSKPEKAKSILKNEQFAAKEAQLLQVHFERTEAERIERRRQEYLARERAREAEAKEKAKEFKTLTPQTRSCIFSSFDDEEDGVSRNSNNNNKQTSNTASPEKTSFVRTASSQSQTTTTDISTESSGCMHFNGLPPCVMCMSRERTHIAIPCMHFSFCQVCVESKLSRCNKCFVCSQQTVDFAPVSV